MSVIRDRFPVTLALTGDGLRFSAMRFMRFIAQGKQPAAFNMALDEAVSEAVRKGLSPPTLRLYQWDTPSVTIGYFQKVSDINTGYCADMGYPVIRRMTGGRAVLHDDELTYSVSSLTDFPPFRGTLIDNYTIISGALLQGLAAGGIKACMSMSVKRPRDHASPACFKTASYGEVTVSGKKVIGSAQKRFHDGFLQQGSVMLGFRAKELCNVLNGCAEKDFRDIGAINSAGAEMSFTEMKLFLKAAFEKDLHVTMISDTPNKFELSLAKELEEKKYATREWNFMR
ncbi:MAG: lipoate--protein ligase family protein [Nitrospirae bacterium]|nr:lipoate--protein ligase family protein [Nitrospirota bacterium]